MRSPLSFVLFVALLAASGCKPLVPCSEEEPCEVDFYCIADSTEMRYCMAECQPSRDATVCNDGSLCVDTGADNGFCYTGGRTVIGGNCTSQQDCIRGGICVSPFGSDEAECFHACDLGATGGAGACPTGLRCGDTIEGNGFCT